MMKPSVIAVLLMLLFLSGCRSTVPTEQQQSSIPAQVSVVSPQDSRGGTSISGVIRPSVEADIAAQLTAPIAEITKREGDHVRRGEVLVRLHAPALQAGVAQANAAVTSAEQQQTAAETQSKLAADTLARYQQLRSRHSVTPHELDQIQAQSAAAQAEKQTAAAQVAVAEASLAAQRANAADSLLVAPFDGVVTRRFADPGSLAVPGSPILHMQSRDRAEVQFSLPEDSMRSLRPGSSVEVLAGDSDSSVKAVVSNISPSGDIASHSFLVKATLPASKQWNTGTVVSVLLPSTQSGASLWVPSTSLIQQGGLDGVLVLRSDNRAEVRYVTLSRKTADSAQVLTGLQAGDRILTHGDLALAGRTIEVHP
jgi:RND family efflux transporter MFP subunit